MHHVQRVNRREAVGHVQRDADRVVNGNRLAGLPRLIDAVGQAAAGRILHHEDQHLAVALEVVDANDVRLIQRCAQLGFAVEAPRVLNEIGAADAERTVAQNLQGARGLQRKVRGAIDLCEGAGANRCVDAVFAVENQNVGLKRHQKTPYTTRFIAR